MPLAAAHGPGAPRGRDGTRQRIIDAAVHVFSTLDFESATMKQIARACSLTDAAIYYYFPSKVALAEAVVHQRWRRPAGTDPTAFRPGRPTTWAVIEAAVDNVLEMSAANHGNTMLISRLSLLLPSARTRRTSRFETTRTAFRGLFDSRFQPAEAEILADTIMLLIAGAYHTAIARHGDDTPRVMRDPAFASEVRRYLRVAVPLDRYLSRPPAAK